MNLDQICETLQKCKEAMKVYDNDLKNNKNVARAMNCMNQACGHLVQRKDAMVAEKKAAEEEKKKRLNKIWGN